jgi:hypothetical protein
LIRLRSAPWDDILDDTSITDELASVTDDLYSDDEPSLDSPQVNVIHKPPPPTHYSSVAVPTVQPTEQLPDVQVQNSLLHGVSLPPPTGYTPTFIRTHQSQLMDTVVQDLLHSNILRPESRIVNAFHLFLVSKPDGSARPVYDLSPWTPLYKAPPIHLYTN